MSLIEIARLSEAQQAQLGVYGERWAAAARLHRCLRPQGGRSRRREGLRGGGPAPAARDRLGRRAGRDRQRLGARAQHGRRQRALPRRRPRLPQGRGRRRPRGGLGRARQSCERAAPGARAALLRQHRRGRAARLRARAARICAPGSPACSRPASGRRSASPRAASACIRPRRWVRSSTFTTSCGLQRQTEALRGLWQIAAQRVVDRPAPGRVLAGGAAPGRPPRRQGAAALRRRAGGQLPRRLVGLCLEGRAGAALDHRASRPRHRARHRLRPGPADPPLHDRRPHARALHRRRRRLSRRRRTRPACCGGSGGAGKRGRPWRSSTARRSRTAPASATSCRCPANMRSAREAVAWTYGLPEQRYQPSVRT